eukprot:CAMPEP_0197577466 /NCGR_PEP_ID=MMETSP1326-20131121/2086_1 /TAXON_ID=1155430 /ORGANISM="Genus nov. species nov., Strain RCC2288" /LENGTH=184 /DNA_ID=CAMNT_0043140539 /DNA_START=36 /DNA_END=586 /DNA_ORIENTATION=+
MSAAEDPPPPPPPPQPAGGAGDAAAGAAAVVPPSMGDVQDALEALAMVKRMRELDGMTEVLEDDHDEMEHAMAQTRLAMRAQLESMQDDELAAQDVLDAGTDALGDAMAEIEELQRQLASLRDLSAAQELYIERAEEDELAARLEAQDAMAATKQAAGELAQAEREVEAMEALTLGGGGGGDGG